MVINYLEASKGAQFKPVDLDTLDTVVNEHNVKPHTPELLTTIFQTIWQLKSEKLKKRDINMEFSLPNCSYTQEEISQLEKEGRRIGYLPQELSTQENRYLLGLMFPNIQSFHFEKDNSTTNNVNHSGWFDYDASIEALFQNRKEEIQRSKITEQKRQEMNLNQYVIAGQDSKLFVNHYLDERGTRSRVIGSRGAIGYAVIANFSFCGVLEIHSIMGPDFHFPGLGIHSVGVPKKT